MNRNGVKKVKLSFVLDSSSDIKIDELKMDFPVAVVPLNVQFGEDHFLDGISITEDEFYQRMAREPELPKTSQPSPQSFYEAFKKELNKGNDVLYIGISSNLSGTIQSAMIGKSMLTEEEQQSVTIINSGIASAGIHVLLHEAAEMALNQSSIEEIVIHLEKMKGHMSAFVLLQTIENLKKGGRISSVQSTIAGMLNIKPMISIHDGIVETIGKFRGSKKGLSKLKEMIHEWHVKNPDKTLYVIHSYSSSQAVEKELEEVFTRANFQKVTYTRFGSTIGTYSSEDAIGFISY
jgi:DegV family protein with EDD domain